MHSGKRKIRFLSRIAVAGLLFFTMAKGAEGQISYIKAEDRCPVEKHGKGGGAWLSVYRLQLTP
jgi:hypothetical protein